MIINQQTLDTAFTAFNLAFNKGVEGVPPTWDRFAMKVTSSTTQEEYGWMRQIGPMREWVGPRLVEKLAASGFTIRNQPFEKTIVVKRDDIEDDRMAVYAMLFQELGQIGSEQPDKMVYELLVDGFSTNCYDGQFFFDSDHPVPNDDGSTTTYSNVQSGSGAPWFLFDTRRALKPMVFQERVPFTTLERMDDPSNPNVFMNAEFFYGIRGRGNVGYGLWQLAFGSKATLDATNYAAARASMMAVKGEGGRKLNIVPNLLVCGPSNESKARKILINDNSSGGETNEWKGTAELLVVPWLD